MARSARSRLRLSIVALSCLTAIVGASPGAAAAATRAYNGPAGTGANNAGVEFGAHVRHGKPRSVFRFEFHNVPAVCQGHGTTAATGELGVTMHVNRHRRFARSTTINGGKLQVAVTGRFARDLSKATGTLRVHGTVPGCPAADTGVVRWTAPQIGT
jgi:hypothetical protein